jgi:hypothetical protein
MLLKHSHKSIASRSPSLSQEHHLTRHKGSPLRHSPSSLCHLDAASTKELLHLGRGSPRPPAQSVLATPHQAGGSRTIAGEPLRPQGFRRTLYNLIHSRITSQGRHTLHSLSSKLSLALITHKACASLWMSKFSTWMAWIWSSKCLALLCTSTHSNTFKLESGRGINMPTHPYSHCSNG